MTAEAPEEGEAYPDDDDDPAGCAGASAPTLRPEDVDLPPRLAAWLAKHRPRDIRRAFAVATRLRGPAHPADAPDADGHVRLGGARPKYAPLEERRVPVAPAARPTPRAFDYEPPAVVAARERRRERERTQAEWAAAPEIRENVATTAEAKALVRAASVRERETDLPEGAGPAGRHEPNAPGHGSAAVRTGDAGDASGGVRAVLGAFGLAGESRRGESRAGRNAAPARRSGTERRVDDNALLRRLPPGERPMVPSDPSGKVKVPRATRQATLDALTASAIRAAFSAKAAREGEDPDETWLAARPKTRRRAIARGVDAEARLFEKATSKISYRGLAAAALRETPDEDEDGDGDEDGVSDGARRAESAAKRQRPDEKSVVTFAASRAGGAGLSVADRRAVEDAVAFAEAGFRAKERRNAAAGAGVAGLREPDAGALLQGYARDAAATVSLTDARIVRGERSIAFFRAVARWFDPPRAKIDDGKRRDGSREPRRREPKRREPEEPEPEPDGNDPAAPKPDGDPASSHRASPPEESTTRVIGSLYSIKRSRPDARSSGASAAPPGSPAVVAAVRAFVAAYLDPLVDVGAVSASVAADVHTRVVAKVMRKRADARDASFLNREKEKDAVRGLLRAYVKRDADAKTERGAKVEVRDERGERGGGKSTRGDDEGGERRKIAADFDVDIF